MGSVTWGSAKNSVDRNQTNQNQAQTIQPHKITPKITQQNNSQNSQNNSQTPSKNHSRNSSQDEQKSNLPATPLPTKISRLKSNDSNQTNTSSIPDSSNYLGIGACFSTPNNMSYSSNSSNNGGNIEFDRNLKRFNSTGGLVSRERSRHFSDNSGMSTHEKIVKTETKRGSILSRRMFSIGYKAKNSNFHKYFRNIPQTERLLEDYACALVKDILIQGRIYISQNWICFHANILSWESVHGNRLEGIVGAGVIIARMRMKGMMRVRKVRSKQSDSVCTFWWLFQWSAFSVSGSRVSTTMKTRKGRVDRFKKRKRKKKLSTLSKLSKRTLKKPKKFTNLFCLWNLSFSIFSNFKKNTAYDSYNGENNPRKTVFIDHNLYLTE